MYSMQWIAKKLLYFNIQLRCLTNVRSFAKMQAGWPKGLNIRGMTINKKGACFCNRLH